jgi:hypothetical protein
MLCTSEKEIRLAKTGSGLHWSYPLLAVDVCDRTSKAHTQSATHCRSSLRRSRTRTLTAPGPAGRGADKRPSFGVSLCCDNLPRQAQDKMPRKLLEKRAYSAGRCSMRRRVSCWSSTQRAVGTCRTAGAKHRQTLFNLLPAPRAVVKTTVYQNGLGTNKTKVETGRVNCFAQPA